MGWPRAEVDIIYIDERLFRSDKGPQIKFFVKVERGQKMMGKHCITVSGDYGTRANRAEPELQNDDRGHSGTRATRAEPKLRNDGRLVII